MFPSLIAPQRADEIFLFESWKPPPLSFDNTELEWTNGVVWYKALCYSWHICYRNQCGSNRQYFFSLWRPASFLFSKKGKLIILILCTRYLKASTDFNVLSVSSLMFDFISDTWHRSTIKINKPRVEYPEKRNKPVCTFVKFQTEDGCISEDRHSILLAIISKRCNYFALVSASKDVKHLFKSFLLTL